MSVWDASFWETQRWLGCVLLAALISIVVDGRLDGFRLLHDMHSRLGFVPQFLGIESPLRRLGVALVVLWFPLSIAFTIATRITIHRGNQVRPKR